MINTDSVSVSSSLGSLSHWKAIHDSTDSMTVWYERYDMKPTGRHDFTQTPSLEGGPTYLWKMEGLGGNGRSTDPPSSPKPPRTTLDTCKLPSRIHLKRLITRQWRRTICRPWPLGIHQRNISKGNLWIQNISMRIWNDIKHPCKHQKCPFGTPIFLFAGQIHAKLIH